MELIFFPTGGGKTEAYLGVIAYLLSLRRLNSVGEAHAGLGVAVILRYTLRLLTLDQLGRAATLVCALESQRRKTPARLGPERFSVGLWVGRSATANTMEAVKVQVTSYKSGTGSNPCPLTNCPWCRTELGPNSLSLLSGSTPSNKSAFREGQCTRGARLFRRGRWKPAQRLQASAKGTPAPRPHRAGRAASHLRTARHDGGVVRNGGGLPQQP